MPARKVDARHELRFETARKSPAEESTDSTGVAADAKRKDVLRIISGTAEVGGRELFAGYEYPLLPDRSYGVFTWFGCEVELDEGEGGFCRDVYTSEETQMTTVVKLHSNFELLRAQAAQQSGCDGPRIAVVGPANCGKSTLAQTLAAYALREGRQPLLVDLDLAKNSLGVPGSIGATTLKGVEDLFTETGDLGITARRPLLFFPGVESCAENSTRVKAQVEQLSESIFAHTAAFPQVGASGMIIDTFMWSSTSSVQSTLVAALKSLKVNVILVVGHDRLLSAMKEAFKSEMGPTGSVHAVVKIARSGGVPETDSTAVRRKASQAARWYFEGPRWGLSPESLTLKLGQDIDIFLTKQATIADESLRPIGMVASKDEDKIPKMKALDKNLEHCLLAVSSAKEEKDVLTSSVAGFVHVVQVDLPNESIVVLAPCSASLASKYLVHGKVKYYEQT